MKKFISIQPQIARHLTRSLFAVLCLLPAFAAQAQTDARTLRLYAPPAGNGTTDSLLVWRSSDSTVRRVNSSFIKNIYTSDGTLAGNRIVTTAGNSLRFQNGGNLVAIGSSGTQGIMTATGTTRGAIQIQGGGGIASFFVDDTNATTLSVSGNSTLLNIATNTAIPIQFRTNGALAMTILSGGNVGIGAATPSHRLHVSATSNPLRLEGLQSGAVTDSILTVDNTGVVRYRTMPASGSIDWRVSGNAGTSPGTNALGAAADGNFLGTTDAQALVVGVNGTKRAILNTLGTLTGGGSVGTVAGSNSMSWGSGNVFNTLPNGNLPHHAFLFGGGNQSSMPYSLVGGFTNTVQNSLNSATSGFVFGRNNTVSNGGSNIYMLGAANTANNAIPQGFPNAGNIYMFGSSNTINGQGIVIGAGNIVTGDGVAIGSFSNASNGGIGIGYGAGGNHSRALVLASHVTGGSAVVLSSSTAAEFSGGFTGGYRFYTEENNGAVTYNTPQVVRIVNGGSSGTAMVGIGNITGNTATATTTTAGSAYTGTSIHSSLQVSGSVAASIRVVSANYTLGATDHTVIINSGAVSGGGAPSAIAANTVTITFPQASTCPGRIYYIINHSGNNQTIRSYNGTTGELMGGSGTTAPAATYTNFAPSNAYSLTMSNSLGMWQSDGNVWWLINK